MSDADDKWLDALRGKADAQRAPEAPREIEALREAIAQVNESTSVRHDGPRELERLMFRLRKESLLATESLTSLRRPLPMAAAAVVLCGVVFALVRGAGWLEPEEPDTAPIMRGSDSLQIVDVEDPQKTAAELASRLEALDIPAQRYEVLKNVGLLDARGKRDDIEKDFGVSAQVPQTKVEAARAALGSLNITLPADGSLRIEFRRKVAKP